jgi:hypothetical protein
MCLTGESITNRRSGALKLVVRWLLGFNSTLFDLVTYLEYAGVPVSQETCTSNHRKAAKEFCEVLRVPLPKDLTPKVNGNAVTVLLQWRCLLSLVSMLERHKEDNLKAMFSLPAEEYQLLSFPSVSDSH